MLLDPVITSFEQSILDSGIISAPQYVSDLTATFLVIPFEYCLHTTYKRKIWLYKRAGYIGFDNRMDQFDWSPLLTLPLNEAVEFFTASYLNLVRECIPSKEVTVRSDDRPWYDSELRKWSRKRVD